VTGTRPARPALRPVLGPVLRARPARTRPVPDLGDGGPWRAIDAFRFVALAYAVWLFVQGRDGFRHPWLAVGALVAMLAWTVALALRRERPRWVLSLDLVLAVAAVLVTRVVDDPDRIARGAATLPSMWAAGPVASWGVARGWAKGLLAAVVVALADLAEVWPAPTQGTWDGVVQLLMVGVIVGYTADLYAAGRRRLAHATAVEAAARERERLAADIHDSVLQVLAYVQHRGDELGGEAAEIGRLAGEQEARLRAMVQGGVPGGAGRSDLSALLTGLGSSRVSVAVPAEPVPLDTGTALTVLAAVRSALDNVVRHAGAQARAWVLLEDEEGMITITVRDDGVGLEPGRLVEAAAEGRLGVVAGIRGRITGVGGSVTLTGAPGEGVEVELRVPAGAGS